MNLLPADDHNGCDDAPLPLLSRTHPLVAILAASVALALVCVAVA